RYQNVGSEHELCWVWIGFAEAQDISPNSNEVANWRFFSRKELDKELSQNPDTYTPWMKMEWERIFKDHQDLLNR
ncbi:MAG: isopentenyl-diphosphate delta-isomerase, partial [bacterium]